MACLNVRWEGGGRGYWLPHSHFFVHQSFILSFLCTGRFGVAEQETEVTISKWHSKNIIKCSKYKKVYFK
jgi:hypothetical protein